MLRQWEREAFRRARASSVTYGASHFRNHRTELHRRCANTSSIPGLLAGAGSPRCALAAMLRPFVGHRGRQELIAPCTKSATSLSSCTQAASMHHGAQTRLCPLRAKRAEVDVGVPMLARGYQRRYRGANNPTSRPQPSK